MNIRFTGATWLAIANVRQATTVEQYFENHLKMLGAADKHRFERWYWCSDC